MTRNHGELNEIFIAVSVVVYLLCVTTEASEPRMLTAASNQKTYAGNELSSNILAYLAMSNIAFAFWVINSVCLLNVFLFFLLFQLLIRLFIIYWGLNKVEAEYIIHQMSAGNRYLIV